MLTFLDFEKPIAELEARVAELRETASAGSIDIEAEIARLEAKSAKLLRDTYAKLTPWQKTQVARHPERPHFKDYVAGLTEDFVPLAGDRAFGDDPAIIGGLARIDGRRVMLIGHEKGDDTAVAAQAQFRHGQARGLSQGDPADAAGRPLRPAGRHPGRHARAPFRASQAEERGQAEAIARSTEQCLALQRAADRRDRRRGRLGRRGRASPPPTAC